MWVQGLTNTSGIQFSHAAPSAYSLFFSVVLHGSKMAAKAPGTAESQREQEPGTMGLSSLVHVSYQTGDISPEASSRHPLTSRGHPLTIHGQRITRVARLAGPIIIHSPRLCILAPVKNEGPLSKQKEWMIIV